MAEIRLPDGLLRVVGEHEIELHLHMDVNVPITVVVEGVMTEADLRNVDEADESSAEEDSGEAQ